MSQHQHPVEHAHPTAMKYIQIAVVLAILTIIEVGIYYVEFLHTSGLLPYVLMLLAIIKFGLVAAFYMHLKFDSKLFTWFFVGGILLAVSIALGLMTLFGVWTQMPIVAPGGH